MSFPDRAESLRVKAHLSGVRLPILVGLTALALLVLVIAGKMLVGIVASDNLVVEKAAASAAAPTGDGDAVEKVAAKIAVHVGGAVVEPGVHELNEGSRVQNAVDAAGGFASDAAPDALNLARLLVDGEQIVVPTQQEAENSSLSQQEASADAAAGSFGGRVNINAASAAQLDALPGIGPSTAEKIVADREASGPFASPEDLKRVSGIGDKKYEALADSICVG